ncbi:unnamed protein product [Prorocentrum cordatum]|uniref:CUE domain-containing protein n=1 Tax=Prorocentrum cordatum TaxID=2364126 RepID=A0ABN9Q9G9_9DINO|nr:unnamed protein product [Polarella glacialis]
MDERAYDYLRTSPPEVQHRVVTTFKVSSDSGQTDFSRAVTGHIRFCLQQHRSQTSSPMALPPGSTAEQTLQMIADFHARYPMDERALQYLLNSSGEAKQRVLTEFRPSGTVDGDYSKAVTAFVRRCQDEAKLGGKGGRFGAHAGGMGAGGFAPMGGGYSPGGDYGASGFQGGSAVSSVEQTARQLVNLLGQVGGQGPASMQAQSLVQQALQTVAAAAEESARKRPRLDGPAAMMQGGAPQPMLRPGGGMGGLRPGFSGGRPASQWGGMSGI